MGEEIVEPGTGLIDVSGFDLSDLAVMDDSRLGSALGRILDEENTGPVAGFSSSI